MPVRRAMLNAVFWPRGDAVLALVQLREKHRSTMVLRRLLPGVDALVSLLS